LPDFLGLSPHFIDQFNMMSFRSIFHIRLVLILFFGHFYPDGSSAQDLPVWKPAEIELSRLLLSDTVNRSTFFLPKGYMFGLKPFDFNRWHVLKLPGRVFLLPDGTLRVYELKAGAQRPVLERVDREDFSGSNFNMLTFIRHDTLWQFGGYGFWKSRSLFLWFDMSSGKWRPLEGPEHRTGHFTLHYYDQRLDCFYMLGSYETKPEENHRTIFRDTAYRFSFIDRRWDALGAIHPALNQNGSIIPADLNIIYSDRGCFIYQEHPYSLFDFVRNQIRPMTAALEDSIGLTTSYLRRYENKWQTSFSLGYSMHMLMGTDTSVRSFTFLFRPDMFSGESTHPIYIERTLLMEVKVRSMQLAGYILIPFIFLLMLLWLFGHRLLAFYRSFGMSGRSDIDIDGDDSFPDAAHHEFWAGQERAVFTETFFAFYKQLKPDQQFVVDLMVSEAKSGRIVTAADISKVMGLQRRPDNLQKVLRNKAIMGINSAFRRTFRTDVLLIERQKSELDRRSNMYRLPAGITALLRDIELSEILP
jgi:hypothetical protein